MLNIIPDRVYFKVFLVIIYPEGYNYIFDLVSTKVAMPEDKEEMALTINGRTRKLKKSDFDILAKSLNIPQRSIENSYKKIVRIIPDAYHWLSICFLPETMKKEYHKIIAENTSRLIG